MRPLDLSAAEEAGVTDIVGSVASSAHFTLVNGFGKVKQYGAAKEPGCCSCKPIAALVITMTMLLALIVLLLVFYTECEYVRAKDMAGVVVLFHVHML